jgi:type IV pilus assembly protein PilE
MDHVTMRRQTGFTLIELMIAVGVVAILAAIAYPSYQESVRKGRRGAAQAELVGVAQMLERHRTTNATYAGLGGFPRDYPTTGQAYYVIDVEDATATTFTATATPKAGTDQVKDRCGILTIDQSGARFHEKGADDQCRFGATGP